MKGILELSKEQIVVQYRSHGPKELLDIMLKIIADREIEAKKLKKDKKFNPYAP